jgi:DNA polymerase III subunit epsilon
MTEPKKPHIYQWDPWPFGLYTKKQLSEMGYKPGSVAGLIPYSKSADGDGYLRVYSLIDAQPKKPMSEKQAAALEKARQAWACESCGARKRYLKWPWCESCSHIYKLHADREAASAWSAKILADGCVILDTETTDLSYPELLQIAVIDQDGAVLLDTLCKPLDYTEPNFATTIHGITPEMVQDAPDFGQVYERLYPLLHRRHVVMYGEDFDAMVLRVCRRRYQLPAFGWLEVDCAKSWFAQYVGQWSDYRESYTWQPLPGGDHSALGDCRATLEVLRRMAQNADGDEYSLEDDADESFEGGR